MFTYILNWLLLSASLLSISYRTRISSLSSCIYFLVGVTNMLPYLHKHIISNRFLDLFDLIQNVPLKRLLNAIFHHEIFYVLLHYFFEKFIHINIHQLHFADVDRRNVFSYCFARVQQLTYMQYQQH